MFPDQPDTIENESAVSGRPPDDRSAGDPTGGAPGACSCAEPEEEGVEERAGASDAERLAEIDHLRAELDKERGRAAELRDQLLRTAADFDNFRKRTERDRVEERKQASAGMVRNLLPVVDGLGRALATASKVAGNAELTSFVDGVRMVQTQLADVLAQAGLETIPTDGTFDPLHHEALMQEASTTAPHLSILEVFEPGYRFGGRMLRPARVKVASNPGGEGPRDEAGDDSAHGGSGEEA